MLGDVLFTFQNCLVNYGLLLFLWVLGDILFLPVQVALVSPLQWFNKKSFIKTCSKKFSQHRQKVTPEKYEKKEGSRCCSCLASWFSDLVYWPVFYVMTFIVCPVIVVSVVFASLNQGSQKFCFIDPDCNNDGLTQTAGNAAFWLAVYFFSLLPFCTTAASVEPVISAYRLDFLYDHFPIAFHRRLHIQFSICGIGSFLVGAVLCLIHFSALNEVEDEVTEQGEATHQQNLSLILSAASLSPFLFMIKYGYKGVRVILNHLLIDIPQGIHACWWLTHVGLGIFLLYSLGKSNRLAGIILSVSWSCFYLFPWIIWLACSVHVAYVVLLRERKEKLKDYRGNEILENDTIFVSITPPVLREYPVGMKHYLFTLYVWLLLIETVHVSRRISETHVNITSINVFFNEMLLRFSMFYAPKVTQSCFPSIVFLILLFPVLLVFICINVLAILFLPFRRKLFAFGTKKAFAYLSPAVGRSMSFLYEPRMQFKGSSMVSKQPHLFDTVVFIADSPGLPTASAYFLDIVRASCSAISSKCYFLWKCESLADFSMVETTVRLLQEEIDYYWISFATKFVSRLFLITTLKEEDMKTISRKFKLDNLPIQFITGELSDVDLGEIILPKIDSIAVVSLGSSELAYQMRRVAARDLSHYKTKHYENCVESSFMQEPQVDLGGWYKDG